MTVAVPAHGCILGMELDPSGTPNVFTDIAEIIGLPGPSNSREATETTPHNATISVHTVAGRLLQGELTLELNFLHEHETHSAATGLKQALQDNETRGFRFFGPSGASNVDEIIISGEVISFATANPVRSGQRTATVTIQPSGPYADDGIIVGTLGS